MLDSDCSIGGFLFVRSHVGEGMARGNGKGDLLAGEWKLERGVERVSERLFTRSRRREGVVTSCGQPYLGSSCFAQDLQTGDFILTV
jgi:hypothetical protein